MKKTLKNVVYFLLLFIVSLFAFSCKDDKEEDEVKLQDKYECTSLDQAILIAEEAGEVGTTEEYYVYGIIKSISNGVYGEMTITDGKNDLLIYGVYSKDGTQKYEDLESKPDLGDEIVLLGTLNYFNGTSQMKKGYLQEFNHLEYVIENADQYKTVTVEEARNSAKGELLKLSGVVAQITYAFGKVPNGFFLVDNTEAIYVYGKEVCATIKVGNKVTIVGEKTYYIAEEEVSSANKYGYNGCCQIQNAIVVSNDNKVNEFDKTWIKETTIKEIVDTDFSENITTTIYKVNAFIKKVPGQGFINYYIDDLDGVTGSYVYTACNGSDFTWLDEFDGKICTVYLAAINAKSTSSGCVYRFIPIEVMYENYQFDMKDAPNLAIEYYVLDQFVSEYSADPCIELKTSVSNDVVNFENVVITYASSDTNVVYFEEVDGKTVLHTKTPGIAEITITATYGNYSASKKINITVNKAVEISSLTVKEAIDTADDTEVTVKGIVAGSLVNQSGFYLIDETGVIAVTGAKDDIALLSVGDEVIVKGTKDHKVKDDYTGAGQINIYNATILVNNYGNHEYSTKTFDNTKTLNDLYNLNHLEDHSNEVYVLNAKVIYIDSGYSTSYKLQSLDGTVKFTLYSSGANQYSFLADYVDKEVTVELAICNWNSKSYYTGCIISVTYNGVKVNNTLNFNE